MDNAEIQLAINNIHNDTQMILKSLAMGIYMNWRRRRGLLNARLWQIVLIVIFNVSLMDMKI